MTDVLHAFLARLDAVAWKPTGFAFETDGDLVCSIYEGQPTGVAFRAWVHAVRVLEELSVRGQSVSLTVPVDELLVRIGKQPRVCLVAWGGESASGCWLFVDDLARTLDTATPDWRAHATVQVDVPRTNATNDDGLLRLHELLAVAVLPLLAAPARPGELVAATGPDLSAARRQLLRFYETGEAATVPSAALDLPQWFVALYGDGAEGDTTRLRGVRPSLGALVSVEFTTRRGLFTVAPVALEAERRGTRQARWSSATQDALLGVRLTIDHEARTVRMGATLAPCRRSVSELLTVARLLDVLAGGGRVRIAPMACGEGFPTLEADIPPAPDAAVPRALLGQLEDLEAIQRATGVSFMFTADHPVAPEDLAAITEVVFATQTGRVVRTVEQSRVCVSGRDLCGLLGHADGQQRVRLVLPASRYVTKVLGQTISLGPRQQIVTGTLALPCADLLCISRETPPGDGVDLELLDVEVVDMFSDWPKRG